MSGGRLTQVANWLDRWAGQLPDEVEVRLRAGTLRYIAKLLRVGVSPALAASIIGKRGAAKGGAASAASLTPAQRTKRARVAARARWSKPGQK